MRGESRRGHRMLTAEIKTELYERVVKYATAQDMSLSGFIRTALYNEFKRLDRENKTYERQELEPAFPQRG